MPLRGGLLGEFSRHGEIYRSDVERKGRGPRGQVFVRGVEGRERQSCPLPALIGVDESPAGYSFHPSDVDLSLGARPWRVALQQGRLCFTDRLQNAIKWFCRSIDTATMATSSPRSTSTACQNLWQPKPKNRTST